MLKASGRVSSAWGRGGKGFGLRRRFYAVPGRQARLARPVISVGNLSMGGRGKTPVVAHIARLLLEAGERPAILTRGYGRSRPEDGVVVVSDGVHLLADVDRSGDEPLMLARQVPGARVLVCDQRALAGALAERALHATVHILDDGFQHLQLARDIDLVIVTPQDLDGRALPFGRLREPVSALNHADAVIWESIGEEHRESIGEVHRESIGEVHRGGASEEHRGRAAGRASVGASERPEFRLRRQLGQPYTLHPGGPALVPPGPVVAVAGIAGPERFWLALEQAGWTIAERLGFSDHHQFTSADVARIGEIARRTGACVLTTEKDAVRLLSLRPLPFDVSVIPLTISIEPHSVFQGWLLDRLREARA